MNKIIRNLFMAVTALVAVTTTAVAQDLSSQRGESQDLGGLYGETLDHGGIIINPTPQDIKVLRSMPLDVKGGVALKGKAKEFASDIDFLKHNKKGVKLTINYGKKAISDEQLAAKRTHIPSLLLLTVSQSMPLISWACSTASRPCARLLQALRQRMAHCQP